MGAFHQDIRIHGRSIGPSHPVFVIAEIGVNHNGDWELAREAVSAAAEAGADCVKFQSFRAEEFMADRERTYEYTVQGRTVRESMYAMFKRLEFPLDRHCELFDWARKQGVVPLTSVADPLCAAAAVEAGAGALKLASEDLINLPLLEHVAGLGLPLILSTGMACEEELDDALAVLDRACAHEVLFLHCVSLYPTPDAEVGLKRMELLRRKTGAPVGYSDHSLGTEAALAAVALGACVVEKHFTPDRTLDGPDHGLSSDPEELAAMVRSIRRVEAMLGREALEPGEAEKRMRQEFRRSLVAARDLPPGTVIRREDLACKRPGTGLRPREMDRVIGRTLLRGLRADEQLPLDMMEGTEPDA